jgi:hypothetical protein
MHFHELRKVWALANLFFQPLRFEVPKMNLRQALQELQIGGTRRPLMNVFCAQARATALRRTSCGT